jgi:hypothetical protein
MTQRGMQTRLSWWSFLHANWKDKAKVQLLEGSLLHLCLNKPKTSCEIVQYQLSLHTFSGSAVDSWRQWQQQQQHTKNMPAHAAMLHGWEAAAAVLPFAATRLHNAHGCNHAK